MEKEIGTLIFLGINGVYDVKHKKILLWSIPIFLCIGILIRVWNHTVDGAILFALIPGSVFLVIGKLTKEAVGYGDGWIVLVLGVFLGLWETCEVILGALFFSALWSSVLLLKKKRCMKEEFPWIPCVLISYVGRLVVDCIG